MGEGPVAEPGMRIAFWTMRMGRWGLSRLGPGRLWARRFVGDAVAVAVAIAIGKLSGLCSRSLVIFLGRDDLALGQIVGNSLGDGTGVDNTATNEPVDESENKNSRSVDAGVVHLRSR